MSLDNTPVDIVAQVTDRQPKPSAPVPLGKAAELGLLIPKLERHSGFQRVWELLLESLVAKPFYRGYLPFSSF